MASISAAHPTLPIPSYARVTNLSNQKSIIVRVNDRGPYHANRLIDVSVRTARLLGFYDAASPACGSTMSAAPRSAAPTTSKLAATLRTRHARAGTVGGQGRVVPAVPAASRPIRCAARCRCPPTARSNWATKKAWPGNRIWAASPGARPRPRLP